MRKPRVKYRVFQINHLDYGDGHIDNAKRFIGDTYAVSEAQAVNNISFRTGILIDEIVPWSCDGCRHSYLVAERA